MMPCDICIQDLKEGEEEVCVPAYEVLTPEGDGFWVCEEHAKTMTLKELRDFLEL